MNIGKNIKLGLFLTAGIIFFIIGLYLIGNKRSLFSSTISIKARFHNISGLQEGNNVRLMGIDVGTVKNITIINDTLVEVEMRIKESAKGFIKKDATALVATDGLVGNRIVNINAGNATSPPVKDGDIILTQKQISTEDILKSVDDASQSTAQLSAELVKMVSYANAGNGPLGLVLKDSFVTADLKTTISDLKETSRQSVQIAAYFKQILSNINHGNGPVASAINDTLLRGNLVRALADIEAASEKMKQTTTSLQMISNKIDNGNGTLSTLLNDTAFANNLKLTILSAKQGAAGFSENMEALKHNFLLRPYFKKANKNNTGN